MIDKNKHDGEGSSSDIELAPDRAPRSVNRRALDGIARSIAGSGGRTGRRIRATLTERTDGGSDGPVEQDAGPSSTSRPNFVSVLDSAATQFLEDALLNGTDVEIVQAVSGETLVGRLRKVGSASTFALLPNGTVGRVVPIELNDLVRIGDKERGRRRMVRLPEAAKEGSLSVEESVSPEPVDEGPVLSPEDLAEQAAAAKRSGISRRAAATRLRKERLSSGRDLRVGLFLEAVDALDDVKARANMEAFLTLSDETINGAIALLERRDGPSAQFLRELVDAEGDIDGAAQKAFRNYCRAKRFTGDLAALGTVLSYVNYMLKDSGVPTASTKAAGTTETAQGTRLKLDRLPTNEDEGNLGNIFSSVDFADEPGKATPLRVVHSRANAIAGRLEAEQQQLLVRALVFQYYGVSFEDLELLPIIDLEGTIGRANRQLAKHGFVIHANNNVAVLAEINKPVMLSPSIAHATGYRKRLEQHVSGTSDDARGLAQAEAVRLEERAAAETRRKGAPIRKARERARKQGVRSYITSTNNKSRRVVDIQADTESFVRGTREEIDGVVALLDASEHRGQKAVAMYLSKLRSETGEEAIAAATGEFYRAAHIFERNRTPERVLTFVNRAIRDAVATSKDIGVREAGTRAVQLTKLPGMEGASEAIDDDFVHGGFRLVTGSFDGIKLLHKRASEIAHELRTEASRNPYNNGKMLTLALAHQYHGVSLETLAKLPLMIRPNGDPDLNAVIEKTNVGLRKFGLAIYVRNGFALLAQDTSEEGNVGTVGVVSKRQKRYPVSPLKAEYLQ